MPIALIVAGVLPVAGAIIGDIRIINLIGNISLIISQQFGAKMTIKASKNFVSIRFSKKEIENLNNPKKYKAKNYFTEMEVWDVPVVLTLTLGQLKILPTPPTAYGFQKPQITKDLINWSGGSNSLGGNSLV